MASPLGLALPVHGSAGPTNTPGLARMAEEAGFTSGWFAEVAGPDAVTCMTSALLSTERLTVGTSVLPIYVRSATLTALTFASLSRIGPGRVICGLGVSSPAIVEQWNGLELRKPITAMREYVELLRAIWSERKVTREGDVFRATNFRPSVQPDSAHPVPVYLGALNPRMLRLAGAIADGVKLNWIPASAVPTAIAEVHAGARDAGRDPAEVTIACNIRFCVTEDHEPAHQAFQREIVGYVIVPAYRAAFERAGYAEECAAAMTAWDAGDRAQAVGCVSDPMCGGLIGSGTAADCRAFVQAYVDAGVQYPVLMPLGFGEARTTQFEATAAALAR